MPVSSLKCDHALHEEVRQGDVHLVTDVRLGIAWLREGIDTLTCPIPIVSCIGKIEVGVPHFDMIVFGGARLEIPGEAHHVLPRHDIHVPHMNVIGREEVFKRIGCLTLSIGGV